MRYVTTFDERPITTKQALDLLATTFGKWNDQMVTILKSNPEVNVPVEGGFVNGKD